MADFKIVHEKFLTTQGKNVNNQNDKARWRGFAIRD